MVTQIIDQLFRRIPVRVRIIGGFVLITLIAGSISPIILSSFNSLVTRLEQFTNVDAKIERSLLLTSRRVATSQLNLNRYIQDYVPSPYEALDDTHQAIQQLKEAQALATEPEQAETIALVIQSLEDYQSQIADLQKARSAGNNVEATRQESKLQKLGNDISIRLELMVNNNVKLVAATNEEVLNDAQRSIGFGFLAITIGFVLAITLSIFMSASVTRPLADLRAATEAFQKGDMVSAISTTGNDEFTTIARIFNNLTKQIRELISGLEQRVADRTKALAISAEVSRRLSAATNPRQLAMDVVEQVQSAFNYYHAHIYFIDENTGDLTMAGGTGEAGASMLARGHKVPKGRGLVGRAAEANGIVLVPDVATEDGWLPNPLLPETKSEIAVPISSGSSVLGVLDVQHNVVNGLDEGDAQLLQSIAGQVFISLSNARAYEESRDRARLEAMVNAISQKIQRAASVEETLQTAARELGNALGATRVKASVGRTNGDN